MIDKLLGKRYMITEMIDTGGMACVYKAICQKTNNFVAVKILKDQFTNNREYVNRFKKEAEAAFSLDHENIVKVTDIGYDIGVYYMVMDFIDGATLKSLIQEKSVIDEKDAVQYAIQVCSALAAAHKKGIIHRDIKPQNILIDQEGDVKLTDFGIAKSASSEESDGKKVMGSVYYISPEQAKGERADNRSDIYSLGIMLYEMVTGILPYTAAETVTVALKHINEPMTPPASVKNGLSRSVNDIILKATSKSKKDRYQNIADFKSDLVRALVDPDGSFVELPAAAAKMDSDTDMTEKKHRIWKLCTLIVLSAIVIFIIIFSAGVLGSADAATVTVPDLRGLNLTVAQEKLSGLNVNTTYEPSEDIDENVVVAQSPEAGSRVSSGAAVSLTISSGPSGMEMPDFVGVTLEDAQETIQAMGLSLDDITYEYNQEIAAGSVIDQLPEAGNPVAEDDVVSLVVSGEPTDAGIVMPGLSDMLLDQAVGLLFEDGFKNVFVYQEDSDLQPGTVIRQSPEQGVQALFEDDIDVWISKYTGAKYEGYISPSLEIPEKESQIKIVLEETVSGQIVNFVMQEIPADTGYYSAHMSLESVSSGSKTVRIYINNQLAYEEEVGFY